LHDLASVQLDGGPADLGGVQAFRLALDEILAEVAAVSQDQRGPVDANRRPYRSGATSLNTRASGTARICLVIGNVSRPA
jgi:hypothetical protein